MHSRFVLATLTALAGAGLVVAHAEQKAESRLPAKSGVGTFHMTIAPPPLPEVVKLDPSLPRPKTMASTPVLALEIQLPATQPPIDCRMAKPGDSSLDPKFVRRAAPTLQKGGVVLDAAPCPSSGR